MRSFLVIGAVVLALVLGACGDDSGDDGDASGTSTSTTDSSPDGGSSTSTGGSTSTSTTSPEPSACPGEGAEPPAGAATGPIPDVDDDGQPDLGWLGDPGDGSRSFGIVTSAGASAQVQVDSASPVPLQALVAQTDEEGPFEILVSDNRTVFLYAFIDCEIRPVLNQQSDIYRFDLGFRGNGTGVGCVDADGDGTRDLVGLLAQDTQGDVVRWQRTIIELDGTTARNGATESGTFTRPEDDEAIDLLFGVSCGDRRLPEDGIVQRPS